MHAVLWTPAPFSRFARPNWTVSTAAGPSLYRGNNLIVVLLFFFGNVKGTVKHNSAKMRLQSLAVSLAYRLEATSLGGLFNLNKSKGLWLQET